MSETKYFAIQIGSNEIDIKANAERGGDLIKQWIDNNYPELKDQDYIMLGGSRTIGIMTDCLSNAYDKDPNVYLAHFVWIGDEAAEFVSCIVYNSSTYQGIIPFNNYGWHCEKYMYNKTGKYWYASNTNTYPFGSHPYSYVIDGVDSEFTVYYTRLVDMHIGVMPGIWVCPYTMGISPNTTTQRKGILSAFKTINHNGKRYLTVPIFSQFHQNNNAYPYKGYILEVPDTFRA